MEFSRQEYWSGLPFPLPEDLPHSGTELRSLALWAYSLPSELLWLIQREDLEVRQNQEWRLVSELLLAAVHSGENSHNIRSNTVIGNVDHVIKPNTPRVRLPSPGLRPGCQPAQHK